MTSATLLCTGAVIGDPERWRVRAATVRESGTESVVLLSAERWFAAGFVDREPAVAAALLDALRDTNAECYALVCEALAAFDVVDRLPQITTPVLAIAGAQDIPTPPEGLAQIASGVKDGRLIVLDGVGHLAPAEAPDRVADLIAGQLARHQSDHVYEAGMAVRREVLGDATSTARSPATNEFTADFQELITRYAWGSIWTRPGLDRRSRSMITLTALVARGHHEELAMHVRAARRNGVTNDEIKELLLQTAIYCGVPDANSAFRIANKVLTEYDSTEENRMSRTAICDDAAEAVAGIADGATVLVGGFGMAGMPTRLIDALIDQGATDLTIVSNNAGNGDTGLAALLAAGRVRKVICSFPRQSDSYVFDGLYRADKIALEVVPQGNLAERMRAAGAGIGAFFCPTGVGTPLADGKEARTIDGRDYVLEYPIRGDVALIGAHIGDRAGNLLYRKTARNFGPVMATAARLTIAEVSRVVDIGDIDPETVVTPGIYVDRILEVKP